MRRYGIAAVFSITLLVAGGCGFRLAGAVPALGNVAVVYQDPYRVVPPPLVEALEARLNSEVNGQSGEPEGRLAIREVEDVRRVLAVSPIDGDAVAYELISTVRFDFYFDGEQRLSDQSLSLRRTYSFDETRRLAAETERRELIDAMHAELADLILLRLETAPSGRTGAP